MRKFRRAGGPSATISAFTSGDSERIRDTCARRCGYAIGASAGSSLQCDALLEPRFGFLTGTYSYCQVFRGLLAACRLEMNCRFPESRRTVFSGFPVILFSFRFDRWIDCQCIQNHTTKLCTKKIGSKLTLGG